MALLSEEIAAYDRMRNLLETDHFFVVEYRERAGAP